MSETKAIGGVAVLHAARDVGRRAEAQTAMAKGATQTPAKAPARAEVPTTEAAAAETLRRCSRGTQTAIAALKARMPRMPGDLVTQAVWVMDVESTPGFLAEDWRQGTIRYARASRDGWPSFAGWLEHTRDAKAERLREEQRQAERAPPGRQIAEVSEGPRPVLHFGALYDAKVSGRLTLAEYLAAVDGAPGDVAAQVLAEARAGGDRG